MQHHLPGQAFRIALLVARCSVSGLFDLGRASSTAPTAAPAAVPPRPPSVEHGRRLFVQSCAHCHGDDARGSGEDGDGPDLYALRIGNARIAAVIRTGIPDEMPSFAKKHGSDDIADLTEYLRTLR
ncbi:MAG: cytochrome c [Chthoniobacter sp.]|uniref:c-type cytochrome n=1 Tax=Chthoniobacter sp. TaxID=2510640 RepID=UPI0032AC8DDA